MYSGTTVTTDNTEVTCLSFLIPTGSAPIVSAPSMREDIPGVFVYTTLGRTGIIGDQGSITYSIVKTPVADRFELRIRQRSNPTSTKTIDWIVYVVTP